MPVCGCGPHRPPEDEKRDRSPVLCQLCRAAGRSPRSRSGFVHDLAFRLGHQFDHPGADRGGAGLVAKVAGHLAETRPRRRLPRSWISPHPSHRRPRPRPSCPAAPLPKVPAACPCAPGPEAHFFVMVNLLSNACSRSSKVVMAGLVMWNGSCPTISALVRAVPQPPQGCCLRPWPPWPIGAVKGAGAGGPRRQGAPFPRKGGEPMAPRRKKIYEGKAKILMKARNPEPSSSTSRTTPRPSTPRRRRRSRARVF